MGERMLWDDYYLVCGLGNVAVATGCRWNGGLAKKCKGDANNIK